MSDTEDSGAKREPRPWQKPEIRKIELTDEEREALRSSDDPMALMLELKRGKPAGGGAAS